MWQRVLVYMYFSVEAIFDQQARFNLPYFKFAQEIQAARAGAFFGAPFQSRWRSNQHDRSCGEVLGRCSKVFGLPQGVGAGALGDPIFGTWAQASRGHGEDLQCSEQPHVSLECRFEDCWDQKPDMWHVQYFIEGFNCLPAWVIL